MFPCNRDRWYWAGALVLGSIPLLAIAGLALFLLWNGIGAISDIGITALTGSAWSPMKGEFGVLPLISGTVSTTLLALAIATPVSILSALYLTIYAPRHIRYTAEAAVGLLGAIPSVIIGLWGMTWVVPLLGNSGASASLVLILMVIPTITLLSIVALRQVPADLIETTRTFGVSEWIVVRVALHHARWGILGAILLGLSRALGEAVAVSMVAGNVASWPSLTGPVSTLTTTLIVEFDGAAGDHRQALYLLACIAMLMIGTLGLAGQMARRKESAS